MCHETDCNREADPRLTDVFGCSYCPECWVRLLPPTSQFDWHREKDRIARELVTQR